MRPNHCSFRELFDIVLPALVAISLFVFSSFYLFLPNFEKSLLEEKKMMIKELVLSSWHMIQHLDKEVDSGAYNLKYAQEIAINHLRNMKYGSEGKDYFWINDLTPTLIMHPYRPELEGQNMSDYSDPAGTKIFMEFVNMVTRDKQGYVSYLWQWKDDESRIVPKLSFVKEYKPWGWVIGTGIYIEDVNDEVALMSRRLIVASIMILILVSLIAWFQIHRALKELKIRLRAEAELIQYKEQLETKVKNRTAELSKANTELHKALDEIKTLSGVIPICMHCKEIRDDKGSWNKLEKYISEHSEAQFSHGICDKCLKEHYPEEAD